MDNVELPLQEVGNWWAIVYFGGSGTLACTIDPQLLFRLKNSTNNHQQKSPLPPAAPPPPPPHPMIPVPDTTVGYGHTILPRVDTKTTKRSDCTYIFLTTRSGSVSELSSRLIRSAAGTKSSGEGAGGGRLGLLFLPLRPPFDPGTPAGEGAGQRRYLARSRNRSCENLLSHVDCGRLTHGGSFASVALTALMTNRPRCSELFPFFLFFFKGCPPP